MKNATRIFDFLDNYQKNYSKKGMFFNKLNNQWKPFSATDITQKSYSLATSFLKMGLNGKDYTPETQDKIGIIANNCAEWMIVDFATQITGSVLVPIYPSITEGEWQYILNESQASVLFISDKISLKKINKIKNELPYLKKIYSLIPIEGVDFWEDLFILPTENEIAQIDQIKNEIKPEYLATIIYTSGTTGNPKGVMLSHRNIVSDVENSMDCFNFCSSDECSLSFLPLNHIFERTVMYIYINKGISVYFAEGMETIGANLKEVKPVVFTTVPRLLEKVYEKIDAKGSELTGLKKKLFDWAVALALDYTIDKTKRTFWYNTKLKIADAFIYNKWREAVGGKIRAIVTGSAACQVKLLKLFTAAKIVVMEGYGLTETSPVVSVNRYEEENRMFGTIGTVINNVQVKIAPDGEILCKGSNVMMGYYKHPELTNEVIIDDWFHTGDIGTLIDGKFLKITDRKKEIFKISGGKYIAPLPIENKMKESPFIEQIMVVGQNEKFVGALIVPAIEKIKEYFLNVGILLDNSIEFSEDKDIQKLIRKELDQFNKLFSAHEQVKKFQLIPTEWTIDGGELTATLKLRRKKIMEKYQSVVEKIYR